MDTRAVSERPPGLFAPRRILSDWLVALLRRLAANRFYNGDYRYAEIAYKVILRVAPENRQAILQLLDLYIALDRTKNAIDAGEEWLKTSSDDPDAHALLADLYARVGATGKGKEHLDILSRLAPDSPGLLFALGVHHRWTGNLDLSSDYLKAALNMQEVPSGFFALAQNLIDQGRSREAIGNLERAVEIAPEFPAAYYLLARSGHYQDLSHPHLVYIRNKLEKGDLPALPRAELRFTLGEVFDQMGLWDQAFAQFKAANDLNRLRTGLFQIRDMQKYIDKQTTSFVSNVSPSCGECPDELSGASLIFVVGMPRSGSTLVEQILASHPNVTAGGERHDIDAVIVDHCSELKEPYPNCFRSLDRTNLNSIAHDYLDRVSSFTAGRTHFVDKGLGNYQEIGFICTIFPRAKVVHCVRNALDTCISCYCTNLPRVPYADDLNTLGLYYCQYQRLMSHWRSILPGRIFDLRYEDLVRQPDVETRRLLAYCELPWHEACLKPHETKRVVRTASAKQVKLPINSRSIGRWKHYEQYIGPLRAHLPEVR